MLIWGSCVLYLQFSRAAGVGWQGGRLCRGPPCALCVAEDGTFKAAAQALHCWNEDAIHINIVNCILTPAVQNLRSWFEGTIHKVRRVSLQ
jgi:hypothetical protein